MKDKILPCFKDGMAQPVFPFTEGKGGAAYDASTSHIMRYCVYVETDYDTDGDGKRDRMKVFIQVPESAVHGNYRAGTVFEACPYLPGINVDVFSHLKEVEDTDLPAPVFSHIHCAPACVPSREISSLEAAMQSDSGEWYYPDPGYEGAYCYDLDSYKYYLCRGFAVVMAGGPGTLGSDGVVYCGSQYEKDAFCAVIEWLRGDRVAYTDRTGTVATSADWANGNVAMTGKSYAGTIPFSVATTGINGLKTIIPVAGIADWYSHYNQQGAQRYYPKEMLLSMLAYFCCSSYHDPGLTVKQKELLDAFLSRLSADQTESGFDYGPFWEECSHIRNAHGLRCSALIVHGLNDDNVATKQFEMMYHGFKKAGRQVKLLLHQGGHITPSMENRGYGIRVDGLSYDDIVNRWITSHLYDTETGPDHFPEVLIQSNLDQDRWVHAKSWDTEHCILLHCGCGRELTPDNDTEKMIVDTDWERAGINQDNFDEKMSLSSSNMNCRYLTQVLEEKRTIQGTIKVSFEAALVSGDVHNRMDRTCPSDADKKTQALGNLPDRPDDVKLTLLIVDLAEEAFPHFAASNTGRDDVPLIEEEKEVFFVAGALPAMDAYRFETVCRKYKVVSRGCLDLCNPEAGYEPETAKSFILPGKGVYHYYTAFMNPTYYEVEVGHRLAVVIGTEDPVNCLLHKVYSVAIDNYSVRVDIPVSSQ